jgi:hypothetical protein
VAHHIVAGGQSCVGGSLDPVPVAGLAAGGKGLGEAHGRARGGRQREGLVQVQTVCGRVNHSQSGGGMAYGGHDDPHRPGMVTVHAVHPLYDCVQSSVPRGSLSSVESPVSSASSTVSASSMRLTWMVLGDRASRGRHADGSASASEVDGCCCQ